MPETNKQERQIRFHLTRYNPETDRAPYIKRYQVPVTEGMTVLEGLHYIKEHLDPSLTWRYSCRMGVCGSCGMLLNGHPTLACNTQILHIAGNDLTVGPLPNFKVIRDLVPDLITMVDKHRAIKPYIVRQNDADIDNPDGEFFQLPEELEAYLQYTYCIKCGCCMAACPTLATDVHYMGPMPLTQAQRYNVDTRDDGRAARNQETGSGHGAFRCHYAGECSRVCPKGVDPAKALQHLKRRLVLDYLRLARRKKPCAKMHGPGEGKPLPNIPAAPAKTV